LKILKGLWDSNLAAFQIPLPNIKIIQVSSKKMRISIVSLASDIVATL